MPAEWYNVHAVSKLRPVAKRNFYYRIVAERKPYFMCYIYPSLKREFHGFMGKVERSTLRDYGMTIHELELIPEEELTEDQKKYLMYFYRYLPVGIGGCVMNKICYRFEAEFAEYTNRSPASISSRNDGVEFDYTILKGFKKYTDVRFYRIKRLYDEYNQKLKHFKAYTVYERIDEDESADTIQMLREEFRRQCDYACQNEAELCDIILDLCYNRTTTKRFAWDMVGSTIIQNLLAKNDNMISFPVYDPEGELEFRGERFRMVTKRIEADT